MPTVHEYPLLIESADHAEASGLLAVKAEWPVVTPRFGL